MQNLIKFLVVLCCILCPLAQAEDFYCVDNDKVTSYIKSAPSAPENCIKVSEALTADSRNLIQNTPIKFIKLVGGALTEMTQEEKDMVLAAEVATNATIQQSRINSMQVTAPQAIRAAISVLQAKGITITEQEVIDALNNQN